MVLASVPLPLLLHVLAEPPRRPQLGELLLQGHLLGLGALEEIGGLAVLDLWIKI